MSTTLATAWEQAIQDRRRYRLWRDDEDLPTKKPVLASSEIWLGLVNDEIARLFGRYLDWLAADCAHRTKDAHVFATDDCRGRRIWIVNDGPVITIRYPHEA
jgi:hypothetical protein